MFSPEKKRLQGALTVAFQYLKETYKKNGEKLFRKVCSDRKMENGFKQKESRFRLDTRKKFTLRLLRQWKRLHREVLAATSLKAFKVTLDGALRNLV